MSRERDRWVDGQRQTAGLVPLLNGKVVLISNRKDPNKWGLPKGGWEEWEPNAEDAAVREAFEEAGVRGISGGPLAPAEMTSKSGGHSVKVFWFASYVSEMLDEWPEGRERKRTVVGIDEAIKLVHRPEHRKALVEVRDRSLHLVKTPETPTSTPPQTKLQYVTSTLFQCAAVVALVAVTTAIAFPTAAPILLTRFGLFSG